MTTPRLTVRGVGKTFPGVRALDDVDLTVAPGEIHALLGENGAGKSTLLRILSGATRPDAGELLLDGAPLDPADTPLMRQRAGVATIYQEFNLVPELSAAENLYLGREPLRRGLIDWGEMRRGGAEALRRVGGAIDPDRPVRTLSVAQQQMVEIARAVMLDARLIIMDEPTAALSAPEVKQLHALARQLAADGVSVLYVTHRLAEVVDLCDTYTVLRDGHRVDGGLVAGLTPDDFVRAMVGRHVEPIRRPDRTRGEVALAFSGLPSSEGEDGRLVVHAGEILGVAGLVGAGRTELLRGMIGADTGAKGVVEIGDRQCAPYRSPREAARDGVWLSPEDRKGQGCFMDHPIGWNLSLPSLPRLSGVGGVIRPRDEAALIDDYMRRLRVKAPGAATPIGALSGGNQQKVLLARSMACRPRVLIVDEPTRGVDVGAKAEVHQILFDLAEAGVALIVISSDMPELLALSDRVIVMREGRLVGETTAEHLDEEALMALMAVERGGAVHV
ncbi:MAG: sugar ABC transporter ATP-binding protein [Brevundimonas sp.]|nr:MAG: sugar ABC transporter ATP-binding protein [Brevundimonas sp.]